MKRNKELHILLIMIAIIFMMTLGLTLLDPLSTEMTADIGRQIISTEYLPFTIYHNVVNSFNNLGLIEQGKIKSIIISFLIAFFIIFSYEVISNKKREKTNE